MKYEMYSHYAGEDLYITIMEINNDTLKLKMWCEGTGDVYDAYTTEQELTDIIERFNMERTIEEKWVQCSEVRYMLEYDEYRVSRFETYEAAEALIRNLIDDLEDCTLLEYSANTEYTIEYIEDAELITDLKEFLKIKEG